MPDVPDRPADASSRCCITSSICATRRSVWSQGQRRWRRGRDARRWSSQQHQRASALFFLDGLVGGRPPCPTKQRGCPRQGAHRAGTLQDQAGAGRGAHMRWLVTQATRPLLSFIAPIYNTKSRASDAIWLRRFRGGRGANYVELILADDGSSSAATKTGSESKRETVPGVRVLRPGAAERWHRRRDATPASRRRAASGSRSSITTTPSSPAPSRSSRRPSPTIRMREFFLHRRDHHQRGLSS